MWGRSKEVEKPVEVVQPETILEQIGGLVESIEGLEKDRVAALEQLTGEKAKTEAALNDTIAARNKEIAELDEKIAKLKLKRKLDEEDLAHMIKMDKDRLELDYDRKIMEADKVHQNEIKDLTAKHNKEIKEMQEESMKQLKDMYSEILQRLPNLNASLKIKQDGNS